MPSANDSDKKFDLNPVPELDPRGQMNDPRKTRGTEPSEVWKGSKSELAAFTKGFEDIYQYNRDYASMLNRMAMVHIKKNQDYAHPSNRYSNFEFAARIADLFEDPMDKVFATMIGIKMARASELKSKRGRSHGRLPNYESVDDTMLDMSVYCTIWASYNKMKAQQEPEKVEG